MRLAPDVLTQEESDAFGKVRDETELDITNFINLALRTPQVGQFRRCNHLSVGRVWALPL